MTNPRPLAGAILASVLLTGSIATPAAASVRETAAVSPASPASRASPASPASPALSTFSTEAAARPDNGRILYDRISGGRGKLKVKNGNSRDAVVTLVRGRTKAISIYVRARSTASVTDVRDGTYTIFFTSGQNFGVSRGRFSRNPSYQRFTTRLRFTSTAVSSTVWTLTLNPVRGGNARTSGVNPNDFPV